MELKEVKATGECTTKSSGGGECKASVEATWEPADNQLRSVLANVDVVPDAAQFEIDTTGSSIPYPASGLVNITLTDTNSQVVQASKNFTWVRVGAVLKLQSPNAVNTWAIQNAGSANKMDYRLLPFASNYGENLQIIAIKAKYENETLASFASTFDGSCYSEVPQQDDCIAP